MKIYVQESLVLVLCLLGALAVIIGAFGAHGLENHLTEQQKEIYDTAVFYHFAHVLAGLYAWNQIRGDQRWAAMSVIFFCLGIFLFSGSLYLLSTADFFSISKTYLGPITPVGGLFFILGWLSLGYHHFNTQNFS